jgi:hypothetical protein
MGKSVYFLAHLVSLLFGNAWFITYIILSFYIVLLISGIIFIIQKKKWQKIVGYILILIFLLLIIDLSLLLYGIATTNGPI